jgi:hypothetical protein
MKKKSNVVFIPGKTNQTGTFINSVLGGEVDLPMTQDTKKPKKAKDDKQYKILKKLGPMKNEKITVKNKITGKETEMELVREGTSDRSLALALLDAKVDRQQKDARVAQYLFERGKESGSFIAELFVYKGQHTKDTQAFKTQVRFDLDLFAAQYAQSMSDIATGIRTDLKTNLPMGEILSSISNRFMSAGETIRRKMEDVKTARMAQKGFGIYVDKDGRSYSVLDDDIYSIIKKEKEEANKEKNERTGDTK